MATTVILTPAEKLGVALIVKKMVQSLNAKGQTSVKTTKKSKSAPYTMYVSKADLRTIGMRWREDNRLTGMTMSQLASSENNMARAMWVFADVYTKLADNKFFIIKEQ